MSDNKTDSSSIFFKINELPKGEYIISKELLEDMIPKNHYREEKKDLQNNYIEWRWRVLKINNKEVIEISFKKPNDAKRTFMTKHCEWTMQDIDKIYDNFVISSYYSYVNQ